MRKQDLFKYSISTVIAIGPLFVQYLSFVNIILLPEIILLPLLFVILLKNPVFNVRKYKLLIIYLLVAILLTIFNYFIFTEMDILISFTTYIRFLFYSISIIFVSNGYIKKEYSIKLIIVVSLLNSLYGIVQYFYNRFTGNVLLWYFPFLRLGYGRALVDNLEYYITNFGYRFSGFFSEPAHFSQYTSIAALLLLIFNFKKPIKLKTITLIIIIVGNLLNASGTGFFMIIITILIYFWNYAKKNYPTHTHRIFFAFLVIASFTLILVTNPFLNEGFRRVLGVNTFSTTNTRVFRPFLLFFELPLFNQIFGLGYGNLSNFILTSGLATSFEIYRGEVWQNSHAFILTSTGLLGFSFYIGFLASTFFRTSNNLRYIILLFIIFGFFSDLGLTFSYLTIFAITTSNESHITYKEFLKYERLHYSK